MTSDRVEEMFAVLQAKQDLHELNAKYCFGVDRRDRALLETLFWSDANIDFGMFNGPAAQFCELISADNPAVEITHHLSTNELFSVDGDTATGRSNVMGISSIRGDGNDNDGQQLVGGRYLDTYARRDGVWKFTSRMFVIDWMINQPSTAIWDEGIGAVAARGKPNREDVSYTFDR